MARSLTWSSTGALTRAVIVSLALLTGAVLFGRADLAVLAAPFVLGTAWATYRRPRGLPSVSVSGSAEFDLEGDDLDITLTVSNRDQVPYDFALLRGDFSPWLRFSGDRVALAAPVAAERSANLTLTASAERWGWHPFGPVAVRAVACDGLYESRSVVGDPITVRVFPQTARFEADDAMPNAAGLVGVHRSRRYGDGGELAGIRQFTPGDRLRRIDWRSSLRGQELHVSHTLSDRDAELVVLLDVLHEAGTPGGVDKGSSVLDTTVRAAAGITRHYLSRGDRVMLVEYGGRGRSSRAGSGRLQYLALLEWLLGVRSGERQHGPSEAFVSPHLVPSSALLVVLTPLLDARSLQMLARLARSGRSVVAIDTLPDDARPPTKGSGFPVARQRGSAWAEVAYRLWRLERANASSQLLEHGIPTVTWAGAGSLDHVLRDISRMAAAPR